ncbi:hypothetical protein INR49_013166 [Caranx melampygus]|nr:hypothetical protein INR49_013166 [Caranx melampygus]
MANKQNRERREAPGNSCGGGTDKEQKAGGMHQHLTGDIGARIAPSLDHHALTGVQAAGIELNKMRERGERSAGSGRGAARESNAREGEKRARSCMAEQS